MLGPIPKDTDLIGLKLGLGISLAPDLFLMYIQG